MSEFFNTPDFSGTENTQPENTNQGQGAPSPNPNQGQSVPSTQAEITALEKLEKFKFKDREYTPQALEKELMLRSDYTKKTQAIAKVKGFYDSLPHDLEDVKANPHLADEFKRIYPKEFHVFLRHVLREEAQGQQGQSQPQTAAQKAELPREFLQEFNGLKEYVREQETAKYEAQLDNTITRLSAKYPEGNEELVLARAQAFLDNAPKGTQISEAQWEKMWKQSHDQAIERDSKKQQAIFNKQKTANQGAKDMGAGASASAGAAPQKVRFKDVAEHILKQGR